VEVWRIYRNENKSFAYGIYATREDAIKFMPKVIADELTKFKKQKTKYADTTYKQLCKTGHYIHKECGLDWEVVKSSYQTSDDEERSLQREEIDDSWHDMSELGLLKDYHSYDIRLLDGTEYKNVTFDEYSEAFKACDDFIMLDEVESFRFS